MSIQSFTNHRELYSWLLYTTALTIYILFNLLEFPQPIFSNLKDITLTCVLMVIVAFYLSMSQLLGNRRAFIYLLYWFSLLTILENIFVNANQYTHNETGGTIIGSVIINVGLNWLLVLFPLYTLVSFFMSNINLKNRWKTYFVTITIDGLALVLFMLLLDPIGQHAGYWTWDTSTSPLLVWELIPIEIYGLYFIGQMLLMQPLRWFEIFKSTRQNIIYTQPKISFPITVGWLTFAVASYWAFRKGIDEVGVFGFFLCIVLLMLIILKYSQLRKVSS
jgi:hypothetical protein